MRLILVGPEAVAPGEAAISYVKAKLPQWTIKGVASHSYRDNNFWIDIDIENQGRSAVITIYSQKFFPESGEPYWKIVPTNTTLPERLHDMQDTQILEQLRHAENDLEEKGNP